MKNDTFSKIYISGIVISTDLKLDIKDLDIPVLQLAVHDEFENTWVDNIYIAFSEYGLSKKFKAFRPGDYLFITGEFIYYSGTGFVIYPEKYIYLSQNKKKISLSIRKVNFLNIFSGVNEVMIKGNLLNIDNRHKLISLSHQINNPVKGNMNKISIEPVHIRNNLKKANKNIIYMGRFKGNNKDLPENISILEGEVYYVF